MLTPRSDLERRLLAHYFLNENREEYLQDLARQIKVDPGNLDKKLKSLEREGLFQSAFRGKERYYSLNKKFPLYQEYRAIVRKTVGVEARMAQELKALKGLHRAILFGSYAKGEWGSLSDIDVLLVGDFDAMAASKILTRLEKEFSREINSVEMSEVDFIQKKANHNDLIESIFKNPFIELK
jgi:predicted nucleotidyltransferase